MKVGAVRSRRYISNFIFSIPTIGKSDSTNFRSCDFPNLLVTSTSQSSNHHELFIRRNSNSDTSCEASTRAQAADEGPLQGLH